MILAGDRRDRYNVTFEDDIGKIVRIYYITSMLNMTSKELRAIFADFVVDSCESYVRIFRPWTKYENRSLIDTRSSKCSFWSKL